MASFSAELRVSGHVFALIHCAFGVEQAIYQRGQASTKVRYHPVQLVLDVPEGDTLLSWAAEPQKCLSADILFRDADGRSVLETLRLPAAYCVSYHEHFVSGDAQGGAYQCSLTLSDPNGWTLTEGGTAGAFVAPAARDHGVPGVAVAQISAPLVAGRTVALQDAFRKNQADPIRDVLGPGRISHPEEWSETLTILKSAGVEIMLTHEERLAYAPGTFPGSPGQIHLHEDASIGALRHEYQHFVDDQAAGYLGTRGLYDLAFRKQTEQKAYAIEIAMMEKMGKEEAAAQLRLNLQEELERLERDLGDIEII